MNYSINLNLVSIDLKNAQKKHLAYFKSQFFNITKKNKKILSVKVDFKNIVLPKKLRILEENLYMDSYGFTYIADTQKKLIKINLSKMTSDFLVVESDPDFDLYYLYSHILEPILIVFGTEKDLLFIHSSAVEKNNKGILYPAWRHTGKTHLLLQQTVGEKHSFMGDDFTILHFGKMYLYPKMINLFSYNIKAFPQLYSFIDKRAQLKLKITTTIKVFLESLSYRFSGNLSKALYRISELAEVSTNFKTSPEELGIKIKNQVKLDQIILLQKANYNRDECSISSSKVSFKLAETIVFEIQEFLNIYKKSSFILGKELNNSIKNFKKNYYNLVFSSMSETRVRFVKPEK